MSGITMAKIFPTEYGRETPNGERKVFSALKDLLPNDWIVFHSQRISTINARGRFVECEADFIIFNPERGYIVMEVKGGGLVHDENGWKSVDRHGTEHAVKDPGSQAQGQ